MKEKGVKDVKIASVQKVSVRGVQQNLLYAKPKDPPKFDSDDNLQ